jgi:predicted KAP-like P-loop ATPase
MNTYDSEMLFSDRPASHPEIEDRLGYAPFAKSLAEAIYKMAGTEGLVLGIHGTWGHGKTTLLNFVCHYLYYMPVMDQPIVVRFNPWWFSGHEDLVRRFFDALEGVLSSDQNLWKRLKEPLANFADIVSESPLPYAKSLKGAKEWLRKKKDLTKLKERVAAALGSGKKRILIIMDDIDRLPAPEIRQIFSLIKSVADFPLVTYLVAFDKEIVGTALQEVQGFSGESYLEKIIQVPLELPTIQSDSLRDLFLEKLLSVFGQTPPDNYDGVYWGNVYHEGIKPLIKNPRHIVRLINTMRLTFPIVRDEVNPVDFIAIETIRVFFPSIHSEIRDNKDKFAGHSDARSSEQTKAYHESVLDKVDSSQRAPLLRLLIRLFPKVESSYSNTSYGEDWYADWRKRLRLCSPEKFPVYFGLSIPTGDISESEKKLAFSLANDPGAFGEKLVEFANQIRPDGTTKVRKFLDELADYARELLPIQNAPSVIGALFDIGDDLLKIEDQARGMLDFGNDMRIGRVVRQLLLSLQQPQGFEVLINSISKGAAISTMVHVVGVMGIQHGKYSGDAPKPLEERLVNPEQLQQLENAVAAKIRGAVSKGTLLATPSLPVVLYRWQDWTGRDEVSRWVAGVTDNDEDLLLLLEKLLQRNFSKNLSDSVMKVKLRLDPEWLKSWIDPKTIYDRLKRMPTEIQTENQKRAVAQFIKEYELREQGIDPTYEKLATSFSRTR